MARDLIPPPSPAGRPDDAGRDAEPDRAPARARAAPAPSRRCGAAARAVAVPQPLRLPARRARGRRSSRSALVAAIVVADQQRRRRRRGGPGRQLVALAADGHDDRGRRAGDRRPRRRRVQAPGRPAARPINGGRAPGRRPTLLVRTGGDHEHRRQPACSTRWTGSGRTGSIKGGTPSETRLKVIHREALELALYTFRYLPDAESVTMLLPPPPPDRDEEKQAAALAAATGQPAAPTTPLTALFYRPGDLKPQLQVPLGQHARRRRRPARERSAGPRPSTVETLTLSNRFNDLRRPVQTASCSIARLERPHRPVFGMRAPARHLEHPRVGVLDVRARARGRARIRQVSAPAGRCSCAGFEPRSGGGPASPGPRDGGSRGA